MTNESWTATAKTMKAAMGKVPMRQANAETADAYADTDTDIALLLASGWRFE